MKQRLLLATSFPLLFLAGAAAAMAASSSELENAILQCAILATPAARGDCVSELAGKIRRGESLRAQPASKATPAAADKEAELDKAIARENFRGQYLKVLEAANPSLNYIKVALRKSGPGYALMGQHSFFTRYSFEIGRLGPTVSDWVSSNYRQLRDAGIVRVGVEDGDGSGPYFSVK